MGFTLPIGSAKVGPLTVGAAEPGAPASLPFSQNGNVKLIDIKQEDIDIESGVAEGELIVTTSMDAPIAGTRLSVSGDPVPEPLTPENAPADMGDGQ